MIGDLKPGTEYQVSVAAYSQTGKGRLSFPRHVTTLSQGKNRLKIMMGEAFHVLMPSDSKNHVPDTVCGSKRPVVTTVSMCLLYQNSAGPVKAH